ncbi:MAG: hypothetical protein GY757_18250 [bacterium]|nr:hypothetical protein [bacterium]
MDGLLATEVSAIYMDVRGYIWFGSHNGLNRFNGTIFKKFTVKEGLIDNYVSSINGDRKNNVWFGTDKGVSCYNYDSKRFVNYSKKDGLVHNKINSICEDSEGNIWFATGGGLSRFNGKTFKNYTSEDGLPSNNITRATAGSEGTLWIGTTNGLSRFKNNRFYHNATDSGLISNRISALFFDSKKRLWIGTQGGVNCLDKGVFSSFTSADGLSHNFVNYIREDTRGNILFCTRNGVSVWSGEDFFYYNTGNGLPNDYTTAILPDREGNIWISYYGGVSCLKSAELVNYTTKDGLINNQVTDIVADQHGGYWIGTEKGLNYYSHTRSKTGMAGRPKTGMAGRSGQFPQHSHSVMFPKKKKTFTHKDGLVCDHVFKLFIDSKERLWIGTFDGLSIYSSGTFTTIKQRDGLRSNFVFSFAESRDGTVWIASRTGINRYKSGQLGTLPLSIKYSFITYNLVDSNDNLWIASNNGVYRYSIATGAVSRYSEKEGLADNYCLHLFEDSRHKIWVSTNSGLSCISGGQLLVYSASDGLAADKCHFTLEGPGKHIWIGTPQGISCFDGKTFRNYTSKGNGLIANNWNTGFNDGQGTLWFGSSHGINCFTPPLKTNRVPPPIYITSANVLGEELPLSGTPRLEHNKNYIRFNFDGLCYTAPESVIYKCRLDGIDNEWLETGENSIFYPYLPPGYYTFRVKALNNDSVESINSAIFSFVILPPFWQTWWFRVSAFFVILALLTILIFRHMKRLNERLLLKERTRQLMMSQRMELMGMLAAGAVHDMKNLMGIIMSFLDVMGEDVAPDDKNSQRLRKVKKTMGTVVQMVKQILKFSRPKMLSGSSTNMVTMMCEIMELLMVTTPERITITWLPPDDIILFKIDPIRLQQMVLNLCINSVHAMPEGGTLDISLARLKDDRIELKISDTGSGMEQEVVDKIFEPLFTTKEEEQGTGLGLFVVKQIVEEYKGKIDVQSEPLKGTVFTILFSTGQN